MQSELEGQSGGRYYGWRQVSERTVQKFQVLRIIARAAFVSSNLVRDSLDMSSGDLSELLTEMTRNGEVEVSTYSNDESMLVLTPEGLKEYMRILESIYELPE